MRIKLIRENFTNNSTTGRLFVDGVFECYTLEDKVRAVKIKHETAIPAGIYKVVVTMSARFKKLLPLLLGVPGFDGIRIHPGNKKADTSGCLLVGDTLAVDFIGNSRQAFARLFGKIQAAIQAGQGVEIEIVETR